ncbi:hypothetical protein BEP19_05350 [Ammoniphilus oxalaticus]|uniref:Uncharacterized protein n=1 Tax=Ammoniphilus oxalaticus TaxID=66863 RepID=A0A419SIR8_9BACL|nr:hypothetical protein [Ammoniphilus oxalaticus]RKD23857.1 hypothetical protein BEP19_05350 [Ammoniphilus oxalaticus]
MTNKSTDNVISLPNLFDRHVILALKAKNSQDYERAREHLEQALALEPERAEIALELLMIYHDLELHRDTVALAERMLQQEQGELTDVLRMYVISLIHLEKYERVCEVLSRLFAEQALSPTAYQDFFEIYLSCETLLEQTTDDNQPERSLVGQQVHDRLEADADYVVKLMRGLASGDFDRQLQAIEQLKYVERPESIEALKHLLTNRAADPILKTFALNALKALGESGDVHVYKWGGFRKTKVADTPDFEQGLGESAQSVIDIVTNTTYDNDPMFSSFALQLWIEFLLAAYPLYTKFDRVGTWAGALHLATDHALNNQSSISEVAEQYEAPVDKLLECYQALELMLNLEGR